MSPSIESCNWSDFISVAYASWYHWICGRTQRKAATIHQLARPSYSLYVQLLWYPMYYPGGMKARVSPVQWWKANIVYWPPLRIRTRASGFKIISGDHYTTTAHKDKCNKIGLILTNGGSMAVFLKAWPQSRRAPQFKSRDYTDFLTSSSRQATKTLVSLFTKYKLAPSS